MQAISSIHILLVVMHGIYTKNDCEFFFWLANRPKFETGRGGFNDIASTLRSVRWSEGSGCGGAL